MQINITVYYTENLYACKDKPAAAICRWPAMAAPRRKSDRRRQDRAGGPFFPADCRRKLFFQAYDRSRIDCWLQIIQAAAA